jgi:hypothetical protein
VQPFGSTDFFAILEVLVRHKVDFVLVGGVAAVLQGAPINTFDLDIVQSREPGNITRLVNALRELDAVYRMQPERRLQPNSSHLSSAGHNLLVTKFGPLDVLGTIGHGHGWDELAARTDTVTLGEGLSVAVLNLPMQIAVKEEVAGEKDAHALPILRRTLEERLKG